MYPIHANYNRPINLSSPYTNNNNGQAQPFAFHSAANSNPDTMLLQVVVSLLLSLLKNIQGNNSNMQQPATATQPPMMQGSPATAGSSGMAGSPVNAGTPATMGGAMTAPMTGGAMAGGAMMAHNPDAPKPIIELMSYYKTIEPQLGITAEQRNIIDPWVAVAKPQRLALEAEYADMRGQLRDALLNGADEATAAKLTDQMLGKEREIVLLKSECSRLLKSTLSASQHSQLMNSYNTNYQPAH